MGEPRAYYNEIEPFAVEWLRLLIAMGLIAFGDVDNRSIEDVTPSDIAGYTQCHFFAGIGGWSYALRLAGWPDFRPVWTLSCPCQPFSAAGKGGGFADERHLWPAGHWLIAQRRPITIFGEQVASKDGLAWLDVVHSDLERTAYSLRALDLCAAGIGAPHIRQRLYFRADSRYSRMRRSAESRQASAWRAFSETARYCDIGVGSDAKYLGPSCSGSEREFSISCSSESLRCGQKTIGVASDAKSGYSSFSGESGRSGDSSGAGLQERFGDGRVSRRAMASPARETIERSGKFGDLRPGHGPGWLDPLTARSASASGATRGYWNDCDWWHGRDEKYRPIEPGLFPLAHGVPARVGRLRGYGNAIVPELAAEFIQASEELTQL